MYACIRKYVLDIYRMLQDKSDFLQDVLLEFVKKYCASRYQTSDLQECLLLCNLQQISRENFRDHIPFPPFPSVVSQDISNDGILTQNDDEDIAKKEIPEISTQNKKSFKNDQQMLQKQEIGTKVVPIQKPFPTKYLKRS